MEAPPLISLPVVPPGVRQWFCPPRGLHQLHLPLTILPGAILFCAVVIFTLYPMLIFITTFFKKNILRQRS
ncbi:hypothetical protein GDO81_026892 [Engystomops pustulosus]|uniref:Uncharacterized protein n=1 Tax=Engystomops pustulosus TaxID=76066 RepID=A0AAV6YQA5_ENGPU|nr:hypothetical protein GDO81_026892 [Engystomops pustulosus]